MNTWKIAALLCLLVPVASSAVRVAESLPSIEEAGSPDAERRQLMDRTLAVISRREKIMQAATDRFLAGEITWLEAVALFQKADALPEEFADRFKILIPGSTEEEKACRQVIVWVDSTLMSRKHPYREMIVTELEAEVEEYLLEHGLLIQPGVVARR
jgi:hypothetical protein